MSEPRSSEEVSHLVQKYLRQAGEKGKRLRVLPDAVRGQHDRMHGFWYYVPVGFLDRNARIHDYYDLFNEIEDRLESEDGIDVLIVPSDAREEQAA